MTAVTFVGGNGAMLAGIIITLAYSVTGEPAAAEQFRVASYNVSLYRQQSGQLVKDLQAGSSQARDIARVIQRVRPGHFFY